MSITHTPRNKVSEKFAARFQDRKAGVLKDLKAGLSCTYVSRKYDISTALAAHWRDEAGIEPLPMNAKRVKTPDVKVKK